MSDSGWRVSVGDAYLGTYDLHDLDRVYEAITEAREVGETICVLCECGHSVTINCRTAGGFIAPCDHTPVTHKVRSITHGI